MTTAYLDAPSETVLEDLDFEPPCDIKTGRRVCEDVATWVMVLRYHCGEKETTTRLVCTHHYEYVISGGEGFCTDCNAVGIVLRDYVVRLEPIKP